MSAAAQPVETAQPSVDARAATNRQNAEHSTGPRTQEGNERVRFNAVQHGMYSKAALLPGEDAGAYQSLCDSLAAQFPVATTEGRRLLHLLGETQWRINRLVALETNLHALSLVESIEGADPSHDPGTRSCLAQIEGYRTNARTFNQIFRHERQLRQLLDDTRYDLEQAIVIERAMGKAAQTTRSQSSAERSQQSAQTTAQQAAQQTAQQATQPASQQPSKESTQSAGGFVPHNVSAMPHFTGPMADLKRKQWLRKNGHPVTR